MKVRGLGVDATQIPNNQKKKFRSLLTLLGGLLLSAFSSPIWDHILQPLFIWVGRAIISISTTLIGGYSDGLHGRIKEGEVSAYLHVPNFVTTLTLALLPMLLFAFTHVAFFPIGINRLRNIRRAFPRNGLKSLKFRSYPSYLAMFMLAYAVVLTIMLAHLIARSVYTIRAVDFVESSIDILGPKIDENTRLTLRSDLRQIENANDFKKFYDRLHTLANSNGCKLSDWKPILKP